MAKTKKKMSLYKKSLIIYSLFIVVLIVLLLIYVSLCLKDYERYDIDNFIKYSLKDLNKNDLVDIIDTNKMNLSKYDSVSSKKQIINEYDKLLEDSKKIKYELSKDSKDDKKPTYDVYYNDKHILTIKLSNKGNINKLGILNYTKWEVVDIKSKLETGLYSVLAEIPENYKLYINDKLVEEKSDKNSELSNMLVEYAGVEKTFAYEISNLIKKPNVVVKDENGKKVNYTKNDSGVIIVRNDYFKTDDNAAAQEKLVTEFDVMKFAENYSLFLTNDLSGSRRGFNTLKKNLIEGTYVYQMAYKWATGIDITFTSKHRLHRPPFTNEKLSNFVVYNEKAFTVDVYLEKNMTVIGQHKIDKLNSRMTFVYYDNAWRLINMESI